MKKTVFFILFSFLFALTFPKLTGRVVDNAHLLSPQTKAKLTQMLKDLEKNTSVQLVVVTLPSLEGEDIAQYGYQLGRHWKIGQKGKDNGVLLIIAPKERKVRIEVGYGLEGVLTDAKSFLIIHDIIIPHFKKGDYDTGTLLAVKEIIKTVKTQKNTPQKTEQPPQYAPLAFFGAMFLFLITKKFIPFLQKRTPAIMVSFFVSFFVYMTTSSFFYAAAAFFISALLLSFIIKPSSQPPVQNSGPIYDDFGDFDPFHSDPASGGDSFSGGGGGFGGGGSSGSW